jgi:hypothetical protein
MLKAVASVTVVLVPVVALGLVLVVIVWGLGILTRHLYSQMKEEPHAVVPPDLLRLARYRVLADKGERDRKLDPARFHYSEG